MQFPAVKLRSVGAALILLSGMAAGIGPSRAADFPFEKELLLDVEPMRGSKRVPSLEVDAGGSATFDLWCNSFKAQLTIADGTVSFVPGEKIQAQNQCTPERTSADEAIAATLIQLTTWRRQNGVLILEGGGQSLRFRGATN